MKLLYNRDTCRSAANALGQLGGHAKDAVPALVGLRENVSDPELLEEIAYSVMDVDALAQIGKEASEAVPALVAFLKHPEVDVRKCALCALGPECSIWRNEV